MIQIGEQIPSADLYIMTDDGSKTFDSQEWFAGRKAVLFSLPGAFTPTCSAKHLPGFIGLKDEIKARGVEAIGCLAVNDVFVMNAWGKSAGADGIDMIADGNGDFTRALGLELDATGFGMGHRGKRFALVAENGIVTALFVEAAGEFLVSSAEHVLASL